MLNLYFVTPKGGAAWVQYPEVSDSVSSEEFVVEACRRVAVVLTWHEDRIFVLATDGTGQVRCTKARREAWERTQVTADDDAWIAKVNADRAYEQDVRGEDDEEEASLQMMRPHGRG